MPRRCYPVWQFGNPGTSLSLVLSAEARLRPLIPSVVAAEAALWTAMADAGVMRQCLQPNVETVRIQANKWQAEAATEPSYGDVTALSALPCRRQPTLQISIVPL